MTKRRLGVIACAVGALFLWSVALSTLVLSCRGPENGPLPAAGQAEQRGARWAQPVDLPGVPNLFRVSDGLYRGAQPSYEGFRNLERIGVKTIVNLRSFHSDRDDLEGTDLDYEHMTMKSWHPEDKEIVEFLRIASDPDRFPVFVHCQHGADRTGTVCAVYRIAIEGWSREDAVREMTEGGYGFHDIHFNLPKYVRELDLDRIKREAGIEVEGGDEVP